MGCRGEMGLILGLLYLLVVFSIQRIQARTVVSSEEGEEICYLKRQLKMLNKPYVKSIKDDYGNIFDCVDIYKQPAFDHPLLKNHTIQMPSIPFAENKSSKTSQKEKNVSFAFNESCPPGTVLIRRTTMDDLIRGTKYAGYFHAEANPVNPLHQAVLIVYDIKTYGARAEMEVFNLPSVSINQASLAQVVLTKGERGPKNYINSIQFGWRVTPQQTGDRLTHFFIYWTSDGSQKTGCVDILCPGFVQLGQHTTPGMILPGGSKIKLNTYKEQNNGNWVLVREYNDGYELIGYWPKEIFNNMGDCSQVQMGGNAYSPLNEPSPPMGNGVLPSELEVGAAFRHVELISATGQPSPPTPILLYSNTPKFYQSGEAGSSSEDGFEFHYGGPGGFKQ